MLQSTQHQMSEYSISNADGSFINAPSLYFPTTNFARNAPFINHFRNYGTGGILVFAPVMVLGVRASAGSDRFGETVKSYSRRTFVWLFNSG